jgi:hypothetical protein
MSAAVQPVAWWVVRFANSISLRTRPQLDVTSGREQVSLVLRKNLPSAPSDLGSSASREVRNEGYDKEDDKDPKKDSRTFHRNARNAAKSDGSGDERYDKEDDGVMQ